MFAHLNATTVLSRSIAEKGIYPAVDPLESTSTILKADIVGEEHFRVATDAASMPQMCIRDRSDCSAVPVWGRP